MIKTFKRLFIVLTAACLLLTSIAFTACKKDGGDPKKDGYTVTVLYPDGSPVKATDSGNTRLQVSATLLGSNGQPLVNPENPYVKLNNAGQALFDYKVPGEYTISLINLPAGYTYNEETAKTSAKSAKATVTLELITNLVYNITVNMPDGTPASDIGVKLLQGRNEVASLTTDAQGKAATQEMPAGRYDIVLNVPAPYGYKPVQTDMTGSAIVINLFEIHDIELNEEDKMSTELSQEWAEKLNSKDGTINRFNTDWTHYLYTAEMKGNEEVFFAFKVEKAGTYTINVKEDTNYEMKFYPVSLASYESSLTISGETNGGNNVQVLSLKPGEIFYVSVCSLNGMAHTTEFSVAFNIDPDTVNASVAGTYTLRYELNYAILQFKPAESGLYSVSTNTDRYDTRLVCYSAATNRPITVDDGTGNSIELGNDDKSATDKNCYYEENVDKDHVGNTYIYRIYIKDVNVQFPVSISAVISRIGDAVPPRERITRDVNTDNTVKFDDQSGTLTEVDCSATVETYKKDDGLWYIKAGGVERKLVASITKNLPGVRYSFATIEYMGEGGSDSGEGDNTEQTPQNNYLTVYEDLKDYLNTTSTAPLYLANYRGFIETYKTLVNKDGVYGVNDEIKLFLERYLNQRGREIAIYSELNVAEGNYWLLACGYYA